MSQENQINSIADLKKRIADRNSNIVSKQGRFQFQCNICECYWVGDQAIHAKHPAHHYFYDVFVPTEPECPHCVNGECCSYALDALVEEHNEAKAAIENYEQAKKDFEAYYAREVWIKAEFLDLQQKQQAWFSEYQSANPLKQCAGCGTMTLNKRRVDSRFWGELINRVSRIPVRQECPRCVVVDYEDRD